MINLNEQTEGKYTLEIKLHINTQLYKKGAISEEMYKRAIDLILKGA